METKRIFQFKVLYETKNLRRASELLGISHSGLSKSIRTLEQEVKKNLVRSEGRAIAFTKDGTELYQHCLDFLRQESEFLSKVHKKFNPSLSVIRIGTFEVFSTHLASSWIQELGPGYRIEFIELGPGKIEEAVANERVDFGITYAPRTEESVEYLKVGKMKMALFSSSRIPLMKNQQLPFVVPLEGNDGRLDPNSHVLGLEGLKRQHQTRKIQFRVTPLESALDLVRKGKAQAYFPVFLANLSNQVSNGKYQICQINDKVFPPVDIPVYLVKSVGSEETRVHRLAARLIRKILA